MLAAKLTIVLPTGAPEAVLSRFLRHAAKTALPYPLVIAEAGAAGSATPAPVLSGNLPAHRTKLAQVSGRSLFEDALECMERVATPYVVLLDPRDFVIASGLTGLVRFLDRNPAYLCAGGLSICYQGIGGATDGGLPMPFALAPGWSWPEPLWPASADAADAPGNQAEMWWAAFRPIDVRQATARGRMARYGQSYCAPYGLVYRTTELRRILGRLAPAGISSALLAELILGWETICRGRCRILGSVVSLVVPEARLRHQRDYRTAFTHFLSPAAMDPFHRAVVDLGNDVPLDVRLDDPSRISVIAALAQRDLRSAVAELLRRWRLRSGPPDETAGDSPVAEFAAPARPVDIGPTSGDGGVSGPERYVETENENAIRATMGSYVYALTRGELVPQPASGGQPYDFVRQQLAGYGFSEARTVRLLNEFAAIRQSIVGH